MGKNPLLMVLTGLLFLSAVAVLILTFLYVTAVKQLRTSQGEVTRMNQEQAAMRGLLTETVEYSKTHPDMQALIEELNKKQAPTANLPVNP